MISRFSCSAVALALCAGVSSAGLISETEPNSTPLTANDLPNFVAPGGSVAVDGVITPGIPDLRGSSPGDVDWFRLVLTGESFVGISVFDLNPNDGDKRGGEPSEPERDGALQVLNSDFQVIAFDDDSIGLMPALGALFEAGTYYIGVSTFDDLDFPDDARGFDVMPTVFDGFIGDPDDLRPSLDTYEYKMVIGVNIVPTPGAASLAGLAALMAFRRRR
ncbi:MAG: hypothetical protein ACKVZJ_03585 [Phycisphaerales bacterium]